jgi:zinc/manganese transport system substrate-binding protein
VTTRVWRRAAIAGVIAVTAVACGDDSSPDGTATATIIATTSVWGDVVANVACDGLADVRTLVPVGGDPHAYEPSLSDRGEMDDAGLVVANGLLLEEGLGDVLESLAGDGANILELAGRLDPLPFGGDQANQGDPHVWFDPLRMAEAVRLIATELTAIDGGAAWSTRAEAYAAELVGAHEQIETILSVIPAQRRLLVTNHDSLGYFAARYGFEVLGTVFPGGSTLSDPSSADLAALVGIVEREQVTAIFAETTEPSALAEAVAAETGIGLTVVDLYTGSLGEAGSGADTLIGMLVTNAERIAAALT